MHRCLSSVIAAPCRHANFQASATSKGGWWSGEEFVFLAACSADDVMDAGGGRTKDEVVTAKDVDSPGAALRCQIERSRFFATHLRATVICESDSRVWGNFDQLSLTVVTMFAESVAHKLSQLASRIEGDPGNANAAGVAMSGEDEIVMRAWVVST